MNIKILNLLLQILWLHVWILHVNIFEDCLVIRYLDNNLSHLLFFAYLPFINNLSHLLFFAYLAFITSKIWNKWVTFKNRVSVSQIFFDIIDYFWLKLQEMIEKILTASLNLNQLESLIIYISDETRWRTNWRIFVNFNWYWKFF